MNNFHLFKGKIQFIQLYEQFEENSWLLSWQFASNVC